MLDPSRNKSKRIPIALWVILLGALAVRLAAVLYLGDFRPAWTEDWEAIAQTLVQKGYYGLDTISLYGPNPNKITSFIAPLYPGLLALMMTLFSEKSMFAVRILQTLFSSIAVGMVYVIGMQAFNNKSLSLLATLGAAFYPPFVAGVVEINAVSLEVFFLATLIAIILTAQKTNHQGMLWGWAGIALGLGALLRPTILVMVPFIFLFLYLNRASSLWSSVIKPFLILTGVALLVISPWTIRNFIAQGEFIFISSNGGINFWIGNNPQATGEFVNPRSVGVELLEATRMLSEASRDRFFYREGLGYMLGHPAKSLHLMATKLKYFLWTRPNIGQTYQNQDMIGLGRSLFVIGNAVLLPFWLLGVLLGIRQWRKYFLLYGAIGGVLCVNVLFFVGTRYRTPAAPYQILFASFAIFQLIKYIKRIAGWESHNSHPKTHLN